MFPPPRSLPRVHSCPHDAPHGIAFMHYVALRVPSVRARSPRSCATDETLLKSGMLLESYMPLAPILHCSATSATAHSVCGGLSIMLGFHRRCHPQSFITHVHTGSRAGGLMSRWPFLHIDTSTPLLCATRAHITRAPSNLHTLRS